MAAKMFSSFNKSEACSNSSSQNESGFTLIELLVVLIIVSVLGTIALPSFLNQMAKARGSEGKSILGSINRAQQLHRFEQSQMASDLVELNLRINGKFYTYSIENATTNTAEAVATLPGIPIATDLKMYRSAVIFKPGTSTETEFFGAITCESNAVGGDPGTVTPPDGPNRSGSCDPLLSKIID